MISFGVQDKQTKYKFFPVNSFNSYESDMYTLSIWVLKKSHSLDLFGIEFYSTAAELFSDYHGKPVMVVVAVACW